MRADSKPFSKREQDVVNLLLKGKGNKQIAAALGISNRTVEFHLRNVYSKLGVSSRAEAILRLAEHHLGQPTGDVQVKSTVGNAGDPTENGFLTFLRRIAMKKSYYVMGSLVLLTALIVIGIVANFRTPSLGRTPIMPIPTIPVVPTSTSTHVAPTLTLPAATEAASIADTVLQSHTVNGYTAAIESYHADTSHIIFQVRLTGGDVAFGDEHFYDRIQSPDLYDPNGNLINTSGGFGPAIDPELIQFEFVPVTLFMGDRIQGQFAFEISNAPAYDQTLAQFRFDFDLPIHPALIIHPKQVATANGIEILLDQVTITPVFTQVYLCFPSPTYADWLIDSESILQLDGKSAMPYNFSVPFDSALGGDRRTGSEPYWAPSVKNGRCLKSGFAVGNSNPTSLTLRIPQLTKSNPDLFLSDQLLRDYPGMDPEQAYHTYLEEHGNIYDGPWVFDVKLTP